MAIDLYSENSTNLTTSPRISFSYDLSQNDTVPVEQLLRSFSSSSVDFNFCIQPNPDLQSPSMADELFSNGKILPAQIKPNRREHKTTPSTPPPEDNDDEEDSKRRNSKSFWGFKRSSSCGNGYARSLCPITLLSRSHSTGSTGSSKRSSSSSSSSKEGLGQNQKHNRGLQKASVSQKPPLRKTGYGYGNGNAVRVNPVLNLGFGSFFSSNSKNKINKK